MGMLCIPCLLSTAFIDYSIIQPANCQTLGNLLAAQLGMYDGNAGAHGCAEGYGADILTLCSSRFYSN